jgi:anti-sigma regulatory factor (Ser/Thr protein kinase)
MEMIDRDHLDAPRPWVVDVTELSQVADARRRAAALAARQAFDETREGRLALVVTEAATNLVKHGRQGQVVAAPIEKRGTRGVEILALDRGPGMANVQECFVDGFSTSGTRGTGLGAIRRLADEFDIHSQAECGTAVLARVWQHDLPRTDRSVAPVDFGAVCLPISGEAIAGDGWTVWSHPTSPRLLVVDGLGHGAPAAEAAEAAMRSFRAHAERPLIELLDRIHAALRPTRGAVVGLCELDTTRATIEFAGVGNIAGAVVAPSRQKNVVSMSGTMGHTMPHARAFSYDWPRDALFVLHSDGLGTKWSVDDYRGLAAHDPSLIAGVLYRDHARGRDDVTVVVARRGAV